MRPRTKWALRTSVLTVIAAAVAIGLLLTKTATPGPARAEVSYTQNMQAVGETRYVTTWTNYGPKFTETGCWARGGCAVILKYWRVSRGTATVRLTTFKVTEKIKAYDYYLLDFDGATSSRSGTGEGGTGAFRIHSTGPKVHDRNDSKAIDAKSSGCTTIAVGMSTPWPIVTASATIGHATMCDKSADLTRAYAYSDPLYRAHLLSKVRHLTMQRWVKVAAGAKPSFIVSTSVPHDRCTQGDGKGECTKYADGASNKSIRISTSG